jgi:hypothetical protein
MPHPQPQPQPYAQPQPQAYAPPQPQPQPQAYAPPQSPYQQPAQHQPRTQAQAGAQPPPSGLPRRVPFDNLAPDSRLRRAATQPNPAPSAPRSAGQMRDRLSNFHQGVRRGKDGGDRDGRGRPPGGSGPL